VRRNSISGRNSTRVSASGIQRANTLQRQIHASKNVGVGAS
jgi:hypothetical protein